MILEITVQSRDGGYIATAKERAQSVYGSSHESAARNLARRLFGHGEFHLSTIRQGTYAAESTTGADAPQPRKQAGAVSGHDAGAPALPQRPPLRRDSAGRERFASAIVDTVDGPYQFIATTNPVTGRRIFNYIKLAEFSG